MATTYRIQVLTKTYVPELGHEYSDAQYLDVPEGMTMEEVKATYEAEILAEEAKRIAARVEEKLNPPAPYEPTKEELMAQKAELLAQAEAQIAELDVKIAAKDVKPVDEKPVEEVVIEVVK